MNRNALLLYLRDLRDLEIVKRKITFIIKNENQRYRRKLNDLSKPNLVEVPAKMNAWTIGQVIGTIFFIGFGIFIGGFMLYGKIVWKTNPGVGGFAFFSFLPILVGVVIILINIMENHENRNDIAVAKEKNSKEILRVKEQEGICNQLCKQWQKRENYLKSELKKVDTLLNANYGLNILANQYRNLASLYYIYDYMSSSQESLKDTLIHEHMENGIQRILQKLDYIIEQNQEIIFHNRILEANNERIIKQNEGMLSTLRQTEINTEKAAQYAEISANYNEINTFFACANYLKH